MCIVGIIMSLAFVAGAAGPGAIDLDNPDHVKLIEKPYPLLDFEIKKDPFGDTALFFPLGRGDQAPPEGYQHMRFVTFDEPHVDTFRLSVEQLGEGGERSPQANPNVFGGNRSLAVIFGFEDLNNWWVAYYTYTDTTSVRRMKDGRQQYICQPYVTEQWMPNNEAYQSIEVELVRDGNDMVLHASANGQPISIDGCRFPADDYTPGKVGLGGHSTSDLQSWYFKNIVLDVD